MKIYKFKSFSKWMTHENIDDESLKQAAREIEAGLVEANLGSGLFKKRLSSNGRGKRGGFRVLLAYKTDERIIFMFGFAKNERENINDQQLIVLKRLSKEYLSLAENGIAELVSKNYLCEVI